MMRNIRLAVSMLIVAAAEPLRWPKPAGVVVMAAVISTGNWRRGADKENVVLQVGERRVPADHIRQGRVFQRVELSAGADTFEPEPVAVAEPAELIGDDPGRDERGRPAHPRRGAWRSGHPPAWRASASAAQAVARESRPLASVTTRRWLRSRTHAT